MIVTSELSFILIMSKYMDRENNTLSYKGVKGNTSHGLYWKHSFSCQVLNINLERKKATLDLYEYE